MKFIEFLSALLTPAIGVAVAYIAWKQFRINKINSEYQRKNDIKKINLELFDRRYKIFTMTKEVLFLINRDAEINNQKLNDFIAKTNEHKFLFGTEMEIYYNELRTKAINFSSSTRDLVRIAKSPEEGVNSQKYKETLELHIELTEWFTNEYETCESRFIKYLGFKKLDRDLT